MSESSEGEDVMSKLSNVDGSKYDFWNNEFNFDTSLSDTIVKPSGYSSKIDQKLPETITGECGAIPPQLSRAFKDTATLGLFFTQN